MSNELIEPQPEKQQLRERLEMFGTQRADMVAERLRHPTPTKSISLHELFESYMTLHGRVHCKSSKSMERLYINYLTHWKDRDVASITRLDIEELFVDIADRIGKTTANRVVQFLRPIFNHGIRLGLIDCTNPVTGFKIFKLQPRERFFDKEELQRLFSAFDALRYGTTRDFLYLCLFTGARRSNVAAMKWADIILGLSMWRIPETKNGTSHNLPLTAPAMAILRRRYQENSGSEWVFPSTRSRTGHLTKPEQAWRVAIERAGLSNARIHDLRRTLASWQAITSANVIVIGQTLNHKDLKSTAIYARLNTDR